MRETTTAIPFPIKEGAPVVLEGDFPISKSSWQQIMTVLAAMEPLLTKDEEDTEV